MKFKLIYCVLLSTSIFFIQSCKKSQPLEVTEVGNLTIKFDNRVRDLALKLNTETYKNANGDDFTVSSLKYYISNITLLKTDGSSLVIPESYYLIDASDSLSLAPVIEKIKADDYTGMSFIIGIDSIRNFTGLHTGVLDPSNGMFMNSADGYTCVKFEGLSPQSTATNNKLLFNVGGVKAPFNCIKQFSTTFENILRIRSDKHPKMHFKIDLTKMFEGAHLVNFANTNTVLGGSKALTISNNYAQGMFRLDHIHN